jgi:hypothetical protein
MPMHRAANLGGERERARISRCGERKSGEFSRCKRRKSAKKAVNWSLLRVFSCHLGAFRTSFRAACGSPASETGMRRERVFQGSAEAFPGRARADFGWAWPGASKT